MNVLVPNFQAMLDGAHSHLELCSETSVVVKVPSERVSNLDTRCLAASRRSRRSGGGPAESKRRYLNVL